jgi:hypothetical protein
MSEVRHLRVTYNDIHNLIRNATPNIATEFNPDLMIAIGERYIPSATIDLVVLMPMSQRRRVCTPFISNEKF